MLGAANESTMRAGERGTKEEGCMGGSTREAPANCDVVSTVVAGGRQYVWISGARAWSLCVVASESAQSHGDIPRYVWVIRVLMPPSRARRWFLAEVAVTVSTAFSVSRTHYPLEHQRSREARPHGILPTPRNASLTG